MAMVSNNDQKAPQRSSTLMFDRGSHHGAIPVKNIHVKPIEYVIAFV